MATYATLTINAEDIIGADFDKSRASATIEYGSDAGVIDAIKVDGTTLRLGNRRESPDASGVITFANLVTTNSASNPASFYYRVSIIYVPKGSRRQGHDSWQSAWFPLTGDANLAAIPEAWDNVATSPLWRSEFRDEMQGLVDEVEADRAYVEARVVDDLGTTDGQTTALIETPASETAQALRAGYVTEGSAFADLGKQAGVDPTGATECGAATQAALDSFAALGVRAYAKGAIRTNSTLTLTGNADLGDLTVNYEGSGVAVQVGTDGANLRAKTITLPRVTAAAKPTTGWQAGSVGVRVVNAYECVVTGPYISGFESGLLLTGVNAGTVYNTFTLGHLSNNKRNHVLSPGTAGWVNSNTFLGGRLSHQSAEGTAISGARHILTENPVSIYSAPNNNVWVNPSVEGDGPEHQIDIDAGSYNLIQAPRVEGGAGFGSVRWGAGADRNTIIGGYNVHNVTITRASGEARNTIQSGSKFELYGSSDNGLLRLQNTVGADNPAMAVLPASTNPADAATGWAWRMSANALQGKRGTDSEDRVRLDAQNGRVYIGNGSAAPVAYLGAMGAARLFASADFGFTDNTNDLGPNVGGTNYRPRHVRVATSVEFGGTTLPAASATYRGQVRFVEGASGVADRLVVCRKDAANAYAWVDLF